MLADEATIERLSNDEDLFEAVEEYGDESTTIAYDIDKLWDGLHCLLTGVSATHLLKGNLLSEAVMGRELWPHESDISFVFPERTAEIAAALNEFNLEEALNAFSPEHFYEEHVYPNIWLRDDKEDLKQELQMAFEVLKNFYNTMAKKQKGVMVIIG